MRNDAPTTPSLLVDRREAARLLCCCPRTIDSFIHSGELTPVRFGRAVRLDLRDIEKFIEGKKASAQTLEYSKG